MPKKSLSATISLDRSAINYFRAKILKWAYLNKCTYPWRTTKSKFHALFAEMLLQRTRAEQVIPIYRKFIRQFPSAKSLCSAPIKEIKDLISSLGLAWRAIYIKKLGCLLQKKYNSHIPHDFQELICFPGVGPYVASAFLSFHCNKRAIVVDSNIVRLYGRFLGFKTNSETRRNKRLLAIAEAITPFKNIKKFNYAVLDLSRNICTVMPRCPTCPISSRCFYKKKGAIYARTI